MLLPLSVRSGASRDGSKKCNPPIRVHRPWHCGGVLQERPWDPNVHWGWITAVLIGPECPDAELLHMVRCRSVTRTWFRWGRKSCSPLACLRVALCVWVHQVPLGVKIDQTRCARERVPMS